jgi:RNA polymerase sigma factor (sigma-70 family)
MIYTAETAYTILTLIASAGTVFDQIIDQIIQPNYHQKPELISELAISFMTNETKVNKALKDNYFEYYFINAVKNQVHSSTSSFHKNCRKTITSDVEIEWLDNHIDDSDEEIQYKMLNERQNDALNEVLDNTSVTYFQSEIFKMYYVEGKTYRQIEKECGVDHVLAHATVKKVKSKILEQIKKYDI